MSFNKNQCAKELNVLQSCMKVSIPFSCTINSLLLEQHNLHSFFAPRNPTWGFPTQTKTFGYSKAHKRIYFPDRAYCLQVPLNPNSLVPHINQLLAMLARLWKSLMVT